MQGEARTDQQIKRLLVAFANMGMDTDAMVNAIILEIALKQYTQFKAWLPLICFHIMDWKHPDQVK